MLEHWNIGMQEIGNFKIINEIQSLRFQNFKNLRILSWYYESLEF